MDSRAYPAFRLLTSSIFVVAGLQHLLRPDVVAARLAAAPMAHLVTGLAPPRLLVLLAGYALLAGGLALALGVATRAAAIGLALVLVPITLTVQVGGESMGPLFKNVALLGSLLLLFTHGAGRFSIDRLLAGRHARVASAAVALLAVALGTIPLLAADARAEPAAARPVTGGKVLLLVQQPPQLRAAVATGMELLAGKGFPAEHVEVLVCGPAIGELVAGSSSEPRLQQAKEAGVRVVGCGLSLQEKGIDPKAVSAAVTIEENGFVEALKRKREGYVSVDL